MDAGRFVGVYDDAFGRPEAGFGVPAVMAVTGTTEALTIVIAFDGHTVLTLHGVPRSEGTVGLSGDGIVEDDELITVDGSATLAEADGIQRIDGHVHDRSPLGFSPAFSFLRPTSGTRPVFAGSYRLTFLRSPSGCDCTTTAIFTITTDEEGFGQSVTPADERDGSGATIGSFDTGECLVTPMGIVRCRMSYQTTFPTPATGIPIFPQFFVTLTGRLVAGASGVTGSGRTEAAIFPEPFFLGGDWTAAPANPP